MSTTHLDELRKHAQELHRAHREGDVAAADRIAGHLPVARGKSAPEVLATAFDIDEARFVVAREAGFWSWTALETSVRDPLLASVIAGDDGVVRAALARDPQAARRSVHLASALADEGAVDALVDADGSLASRISDEGGWTPLLCVTCSAYAPSVRDDARVRIARRLVEMGADVDAVAREPGVTSESGVLGGYEWDEWRPLEGAAGRVARVDLVRLLLDGGADPKKTGSFLTQAVKGGSGDVLKLALASGPPWWQVTHALRAAVELDRPDMVRLLRGSAVRANIGARALGDAIRLGRGTDLVEILVGEPTEENRAVRREAYALAVRHGHTAAAEILLRLGADDAAVTPADRLIGACVRGDPLPAKVVLRDDDHRMLGWALRSGHLDAVPRMLAAGLDPNVQDKEGESPIHLAVRAADGPTIEALLLAGASVNARNFDDQTALDVALARGDEVRAKLLVEAGAISAEHNRRGELAQLFERAADAVAFGDLEGLRAALDREPALVRARSPRRHRATLLHYSAANGTEAPRQRTPSNAAAIAQLLVERGAEVDAPCRLYGGGATTMGLLLSSSIPQNAGLDGDLVRVLVRAGAKLDDGLMVGAIEMGQSRSTAALIEGGLPLDNLLYAAAVDRVDVLDQLLRAGFDVNTRYRIGLTALHAAAYTGHARAVRFLLEHGADATIRETHYDNTPADGARYHGRHEIADLLEPRR
jgi:ankyrin repeat protein